MSWNRPVFDFAIIAFALSLLGLFILVLMTGAPPVVLAAFLPAAVWAIVLGLKGPG
jgi:hypothetical protein